MKLKLLFITILLSISCSAKVKEYKVKVVNTYAHDVSAFTQGLFFYNGQLYETTGEYGKSSLRKVNLADGSVSKRVDFNKKYFVEGSVVFKNQLYILTWTNKVVFVYDIDDFEYKKAYSYPREGWGLTTDGKSLIASDGSSKIYYLDENLKVEHSINVTMNGRSLRYINELEYINGKIWANIYTTDMIVIINPKTGEVEASIDCSNLLNDYSNVDVLNGIAYDGSKIYITGKNWPKLFEIEYK